MLFSPGCCCVHPSTTTTTTTSTTGTTSTTIGSSCLQWCVRCNPSTASIVVAGFTNSVYCGSCTSLNGTHSLTATGACAGVCRSYTTSFGVCEGSTIGMTHCSDTCTMTVSIAISGLDGGLPISLVLTYSAVIADTGCGPFVLPLTSTVGQSVCLTPPATVSVTG